MANVYVSSIGVPKRARNKRIYGGVSFQSTNDYTKTAESKSKHFEIGKINELTSHNVNVEFTEPFVNQPIGIGNIQVYRLEYIGSLNGYVRTDVLHYFPDGVPILYKTGFSLTIDSSENLLGVTIEYIFTE